MKLIPVIAFAAASVHAWGDTLGHPVTGTIAQKYLNANGIKMVSNLVESQFSGSLAGQTANWADVTARNTIAGSAAWHFVDMQANPPAACGFIPSDCAQGNCIIGAMTRFTNVLLNSKCAPSTATTQAVEFLVHFLGDITQPLHNCKRDVGGNSDTVTFNGASTNFHHIHDTDIPAAYAVEKGYGATDIQGVAGYLDSKYSTNIAAYTSPVYIDIHTTDSYGNLVATIAMANDGNALDCSKSAFWTLYDQDPNQDFGGAYYDATKDLLMEQVAKAGYRIAAWMNSIADTCYGSVPSSSVKTSSSTKVIPNSSSTVSNRPATTTSVPTTSVYNTCPHSECQVGKKMAHACSACATEIYGSRRSCSTGTWDATCVALASSLCGLSC